MRGAEQWQYPVKWCERDARAGKMKMERAGAVRSDCGDGGGTIRCVWGVRAEDSDGLDD